MLKLNVIIYAILGLFLMNLANAATIHGSIYDLSLKRTNNAIVEINTTPKQFFVSQNGSYSFNVPNGDYIIKAKLMHKNSLLASVHENITINQDGSYVLDLILFPDVEEGVEEINLEVNGSIVEAKKSNILIKLVALLGLIIVLLGAYYYAKKLKQKREIKTEDNKGEEKYEDDYLSQLINIIKKEGGRATQKDIRKQLPLSEAKISLMVAELEHKGVIEKIKKGRGNIIILKSK